MWTLHSLLAYTFKSIITAHLVKADNIHFNIPCVRWYRQQRLVKTSKIIIVIMDPRAFVSEGSFIRNATFGTRIYYKANWSVVVVCPRNSSEMRELIVTINHVTAEGFNIRKLRKAGGSLNVWKTSKFRPKFHHPQCAGNSLYHFAPIFTKFLTKVDYTWW